jgi:predicted RNase H-like HicB family nuclease
MQTKDLTKVLKADVLRRAEKAVAGYKVIIEPNQKFGFAGSVVEFPTILGRGKTREECLQDTQEALRVAAATMLHFGGSPPKPAPAQARTEQVNIRVTSTEKDLMTKAAKNLGFRGVGDFVRNTVMGCVKSIIGTTVS